MSKLTATQEKFLTELYGPANGNLKAAAKAAIGSEDYSSIMTDELLEAIKKRGDSELVMNVPKAVYIMQKMLDDPGAIFAIDKLHKVAADILDRAGLSKQERPQHSSMTIGIVMLPNKSALPLPPPTIEIDSIPIPIEDKDGLQAPSAQG